MYMGNKKVCEVDLTLSEKGYQGTNLLVQYIGEV